MRNVVLSLTLAGVLLGASPFGWAQQQAPTCTVTPTASGVCVEGSLTAASAPVTITLTRDVLCIERTATGRTLRRQATLSNMQQVTPPASASGRQVTNSAPEPLAQRVTFEICVDGTLIPPCPDDAVVNVDELTLTTQPEIPGCVLPTTPTTP